MKNLFIISAIIFCFNISKTNSQELLALSNNKKKVHFKYETSKANTSKMINLLGDQTFTYKYKGKQVTVVFDGENHIEYFDNKKHFIKSKIIWTSAETCTMSLVESNLPNFPFRAGTLLDLKVTKVKRGYIYYESTLGGRTWEGKMKKQK